MKIALILFLLIYLSRNGSSPEDPFLGTNISCLGQDAFIGVPAVLVEIMLGRYVIGNVTRAWSMCPPMKGILICLIGTTFASTIYNNLCSLYLLKYVFSSFSKNHNWNKCEQPWAKINCYEIGQKKNAYLKCLETQSKEFCRNLIWESSGMQYWRYHITNTKDVWNVLLSIMCLFMSVCVTVMIIYKGIRSMEKMMSFMVLIPVTSGLLLTFPSFSLPQALFGIKKCLTFNWNMLLEKQIWIAAFEDTFTLLGLGRLSLSFVSSHGKFTDDTILDVVIITSGSLVLCIITTFPFLSVMISYKYIEDEEKYNNLVFEDIEDVFITMSEALLQYPFPKELWSVISYFQWFIMSSNTQAVMVLAMCETLAGLFNKLDQVHVFVGVFSVLSFIVSIALIFIPFDFSWVFCTSIITIVFLQTITWQLFYGIKKFNKDYYFMMGYPLPVFLKCTWFTLLVLSFIGLIIKMYYNIPNKPLKYIVFIYIGVPVLIYVLTILVEIILYSKKNIKEVFMANPNWGPDNPLLKESRIIFDTGTVTTEFMYRQELYRKPLMKAPDISEQNIVQLI